MRPHPPLMITAAVLLTVLGCARGTAPESPTTTAETEEADTPDAPDVTEGADEDSDDEAADLPDYPDAQRVEFQELTLWLPAEWEVRVDEYALRLQNPDAEHYTDEFEDFSAAVLTIATDQAADCEWDAVATGVPLDCPHVLLLSEEARGGAHALAPLTEDLPVAWGAQPPFCEDSIAPSSETNDNPTEPELLEHVTIDGTSVSYAEFLVPCVEEGTSNTPYYAQRLWHFPRTTVVDEFEHQELVGLLDVARVAGQS